MPPPSSITPPLNSPLVSSKSSSNLNRRNQAGETKLHRAAAAGKLEEVRDLLQQGAQVNVQCNAGWSPLHKACLKGYDQIVRILCENGARTDIVSNDEHDTPLHDACSNGHEQVVRILLEFGANPGVHNSEGLFPHETLHDDLEELKQILKDRAKELKETTMKKEHDEREDSEPPISPATKRHSRRASTASDVPTQPSNPGNGRPKRGAPFAKDDFLARDIHYMDSHRRGHLHLQALQGNTAFVRELLFMGARPLAGDRDGNHPLHLAARGGHHDVVVALLEYGALVNAQNKAGETPLHEVAGRGHIDIVNTLLIVEADPTIKDKKGRTALDVALEASGTAAEGEIDMLREKFMEILEKKGVLPEDMENTNIKMEDSDDPVPAVSEEVEMDNHANGTCSITPKLSPKLLITTLPIDDAVHEETPEPVVIVKSFSREPTERVQTPPHVEPEAEEEQPEEMQVDLPEPSPMSVPSPSPVPSVASEINVVEEIALPGPEVSTPVITSEAVEDIPVEIAEAAPEAVIVDNMEEEIIVKEKAEEILPPADADKVDEEAVVEIEETVTQEIVPPEPTIQPLWEQLMSLESIPTCARKELSLFLPLYTMRFMDGMMQGTYIAHTQLCGLLGFKTYELFERCIFPRSPS
jgi:ankyrin repeat protein